MKKKATTVKALEAAFEIRIRALQNQINALPTAFDVQRLRARIVKLENAPKPPPKPTRHLWRTADGEYVEIQKMTTEHICNCIYGCFAKPGSPAHTEMVRVLTERAKHKVF